MATITITMREQFANGYHATLYNLRRAGSLTQTGASVSARSPLFLAGYEYATDDAAYLGARALGGAFFQEASNAFFPALARPALVSARRPHSLDINYMQRNP